MAELRRQDLSFAAHALDLGGEIARPPLQATDLLAHQPAEHRPVDLADRRVAHADGDAACKAKAGVVACKNVGRGGVEIDDAAR